MMNIFAGFYNPTILETTLLIVLLIGWFLFVASCIFVGINILLYIISRITKKDLTFEIVFLNKRMKRLYPKIAIIVGCILITLWVYFGLVDN